ncbi:MAG TPA: class I SAM-dependent methyltransferase [Baekduia sp.]|uniref:class I SAM-dependent methyltransferase n=1 Tax=Baekduia sp. TaxID=2600305 RepID=UPI002D78EC4A|nr:class I SAM-dependent methyltransferase [Baekduia sp.]HET6506036.1 class I SAM-dependent methyltransferase [Baekduia sp.]
MAPHYEAFVGSTETTRYYEWLEGLLELPAAVGVTGGRALDIGCGTGRSMLALRAAGFDAAGIDPSRGMMEIARERLGADAVLEVGGLPNLPDGPPAALVTAFNDIINCVGTSRLGEAMGSMAARVAPGGALLFDSNAPLTFKTFFGSTFARAEDDLFLVWESLGAVEDNGYRADLHAFEIDPETPGRWKRSVSHHLQHLHPHAAIVAAIEAAGLELVLVQGQRDSGPRDHHFDEEIHSKRIYLARRP